MSLATTGMMIGAGAAGSIEGIASQTATNTAAAAMDANDLQNRFDKKARANDKDYI